MQRSFNRTSVAAASQGDPGARRPPRRRRDRSGQHRGGRRPRPPAPADRAPRRARPRTTAIRSPPARSPTRRSTCSAPSPTSSTRSRIVDGIRWLLEDGIPNLPEHCLGRTIIDDGGDNGEVDDGRARRAPVLDLGRRARHDDQPDRRRAARVRHQPVQWQLLVGRSVAGGSRPSRRRCATASPIRFFMRRTRAGGRSARHGDPGRRRRLPRCSRRPTATRRSTTTPTGSRSAATRSTTSRSAPASTCASGAPLLRLEVTELLRELATRVPRHRARRRAGARTRAT